jgi:RimJ/RimL family protein N-acetyltransferase
MNHPILIDTKDLLLHPFRAEEMKRLDSLSQDIHNLFNQSQAKTFLPHKKLKDVQQAEALLQTALMHQYNGSSQWYFITDKVDQRTIGMVELITPQTAKKHYRLKQYPYFLEFCLCSTYSGKGIMSNLLPRLIRKLKQKGISEIGAVVHPHNLAAISVLKKSGIQRQTRFDDIRNLYYN